MPQDGPLSIYVRGLSDTSGNGYAGSVCCHPPETLPGTYGLWDAPV